MIDRIEVHNKLVQIVRPYAREAGVVELTGETRLVEDLGVTSGRLIEILIEAEDGFGIVIADSALDSLRTIGGAVDVICAEIAKQRPEE